VWLAFGVATLLFYFAPLFSSNASIHWDLADVTYPVQRYFAESIHAGKLPFWTPYLYSGTPFLSDPKVGAWYPLHWPFFAIGITPRSLQWELALNSFLALAGAFLLARRLLGSATAALSATIFYAWGGYFAARSSELAKFEAAALLPWLLWAALVALETGSPRFVAWAGLVGGAIALAGDFPSTVFCAIALVLFVAAVHEGWKRSIAVAAVSVACAGLIGAIVVVPDLQLAAASMAPPASQNGLTIKALAGIISADYWGVISGLYKGPDEMRQFYLYGGLLLAPMAIAGLARKQKLWVIAGLILPALWFAWGPAAGLYRVLLRVPGLNGRTSPMDSWFVVALGLSLLAASGSMFIAEQMKRPHLWIFLVGLIAADLWYWNMYQDPLVYARSSFQTIYGRQAERFEQSLSKVKKPPFFRFWAAPETAGLGPADEPLLSRTEVSYGSGLAMLNRYSSYLSAMESNPALLGDLAITHGFDIERGIIVENPMPLPRVTAPLQISFAANQSAAHETVKNLNPSMSVVVEAPPRAISPQGSTLNITNYDSTSYTIRTDAPAEFLLKLAVPFYTGWKASVDDAAVAAYPADEALQGVFVPAGRHQVKFWFEQPGFRGSVALSVVGLLVCAGLCILPSAFFRLFR
jgi:Bacterial membrane protein YfhO